MLMSILIKDVNGEEIKSPTALKETHTLFNYDAPETKEELVKLLEMVCHSLQTTLDYSQRTVFGVDKDGNKVKRVTKTEKLEDLSCQAH